jgi:hypothetical protein
VLDHLFPSGARRGTEVEVTAVGKFDRWPVEVWTSSPNLVVRALEPRGKLAIRVDAGTVPDRYWIRLVDAGTASAPRPFMVGTLPEVVEIEPNDHGRTANRVDGSTTIDGRLSKPGDVDSFIVRLRQGQRLVAALEANRRLGSPMDAVLQIVSQDGFVLAQVDDELERDPRLVFEAPCDGAFVTRIFAFPFVQDSTIRFGGSDAYVYQLTLTTSGFLDHAWPLAVSRSGSTGLTGLGWNLADTSRLRLEFNLDQGHAFAWEPTLANTVPVVMVDALSTIETEPNGLTDPGQLRIPFAVSGQLEKPGDVDVYQFDARSGESVLIRLESRSFGQALDGVLRIIDASGARLAEVDDSRRSTDPEIRFKPPRDGTYRVVVKDLHQRGGSSYAYLLTGEIPRPDFTLKLAADQMPIEPGKPLTLSVEVKRTEGNIDPIEIALAERIDGLTCSVATSAPTGATSRSVTLSMNACDCFAGAAIRVVGQSASRRRFALAPVTGRDATIDTVWIAPRPVANAPR